MKVRARQQELLLAQPATSVPAEDNEELKALLVQLILATHSTIIEETINDQDQ